MTVYEIRVKGHLDQRWSTWFDGMTVTNEANGDTVFSGPVVDQAALCSSLEAKKIRAGLDVFDPEPAEVAADFNDPILALPNPRVASSATVPKEPYCAMNDPNVFCPSPDLVWALTTRLVLSPNVCSTQRLNRRVVASASMPLTVMRFWT